MADTVIPAVGIKKALAEFECNYHSDENRAALVAARDDLDTEDQHETALRAVVDLALIERLPQPFIQAARVLVEAIWCY